MLYVVVLLYHTLYFVPRRHQGINHITLPSSSLHIIASVPIFSTPNPTSSVGFIKVRFYTINYFKLRCIGISSLYGPVPTALLIRFYSKIPRSAVRTGPELKICIPTTNIDFKRISNEYINSFYSSSYSTPCPGFFKSSHEY